MINKEVNIRILEEAAENYRRKSYNTAMIPPLDGPTDEYGGSIKNAFKAGAEWMEKEINKELIKAMEKVHEIRDVDYGIHVDTSANGSFETISYYENGKLVGQERSKKED